MIAYLDRQIGELPVSNSGWGPLQLKNIFRIRSKRSAPSTACSASDQLLDGRFADFPKVTICELLPLVYGVAKVHASPGCGLPTCIAVPPPDKTDLTDKTPLRVQFHEVLSVKSVLSGGV